MGAVLGIIVLIGVVLLFSSILRFQDRIGERVERRVLQSTVLRDERSVGMSLAEGWVIAYRGTPKEAIDHFLSRFRAPSCTIERRSDSEVAIGFEYGTKSLTFDTRQLLLCRLSATYRPEGAAVAFSVVKNPMTTRTNEGAQRLSDLARKAFL